MNTTGASHALAQSEESWRLSRELLLGKLQREICNSVAPAWPLDQSIAVNPFWGRACEPIEEVLWEVGKCTGSPLWMSRKYFLTAWNNKEFGQEDLSQAITESGQPFSPEELFFEEAECGEEALLLPSDCIVREGLSSWSSIITHQVGQVCAACFDHTFSDWNPYRGGSLLDSWLKLSQNDRGLSILAGIPGFHKCFQDLPNDPLNLLVWATSQLELSDDELPLFLRCVLQRVGGWASWCRYLEWQASFNGEKDDHLSELLSLRAAWRR